jgi:hypothetical protein
MRFYNLFLVYSIYQKQMTSWIRAPPAKRPEQKGLFLETSDAGFCANFNQYLYGFLYSMTQDKPLFVYDYANPVAISYPLIKNTFVDISGVTYTDGMTSSTSSIKRLMPRVMDNVRSMPMATVRAIAQRIFQWNNSLVPTLKGIISGSKLPASFDLGVHIRVGDRITTRDKRTVPVEDYLRAAKKVLAGRKESNIFLMSDSVNAIAEFKKKADASWKIYSLPSTLPNPDGHLQAQFNKAAPRARMAAYQTFMAELLIMQSVPDIICTFSSNVGRFLYYTVEFPERVVSLDEKFSVK